MLSSSRGQGAALLKLHEACRAHLDEFIGQVTGLDALLALEADLGIWLEVLDSRPETSQYRSARRDLGLSFYSVAVGLYRQAFGGLRSFIEVAFGTLHLSSAEFQRRKWVSGRRDLSWTEISSQDAGMFSVPYIREFMPSAIVESTAMGEKARKAYRKCSEYLHGNVATTALLPTEIAFVEDPIREWSIAAENTLLSLHHSLFVRYYNDLSVESRQRLESVLEQHLSHLRSVRDALGLPIEEN